MPPTRQNRFILVVAAVRFLPRLIAASTEQPPRSNGLSAPDQLPLPSDMPWLDQHTLLRSPEWLRPAEQLIANHSRLLRSKGFPLRRSPSFLQMYP